MRYTVNTTASTTTRVSVPEYTRLDELLDALAETYEDLRDAKYAGDLAAEQLAERDITRIKTELAEARAAL